MKIRWLDKLGVMGSLFALACCLGLPGMVAFLSAIGVGFLIKDAILIPLLVLFMIVGLVGLFRSFQRHGKPQAMLLNGLSAITVMLMLLVWFNRPLIYLGALGLVASSLWDMLLHRRHTHQV